MMQQLVKNIFLQNRNYRNLRLRRNYPSYFAHLPKHAFNMQENFMLEAWKSNHFSSVKIYSSFQYKTLCGSVAKFSWRFLCQRRFKKLDFKEDVNVLLFIARTKNSLRQYNEKIMHFFTLRERLQILFHF